MSFSTFRRKLRRKLRRVFARRGGGPSFIPSECISGQSVSFAFKGQDLRVEADFRTPLYEIVAEISGYDCYQFSEIAMGESETGLIVDAGGNIGVAAIVMALQFSRPVISLEPIPANCEWLRRNLEENQIKNVEIWPVALAGKPGRAWLWSDPQQSVSAHANEDLVPGDSAGLDGVEVDVVDIPALLRRSGETSIALLKMDIEGAEHDVIRSLSYEIASRVRRISMEVHERGRGATISAIRRHLEGLGYTVTAKPQYLGRTGLHHLLAVRS